MSDPTEPRAGLTLLAIHFGMFDYSVRVIIGDERKAVEWVKWYYDDQRLDCSDGERRGCYFKRHGRCGVLWIPRLPKTPVEHGTLAHEAVHAINALFD